MASSWNSTASDDWSVAGDWIGGVPNSASALAYITLAGSYTVGIAAGEAFTVATLQQTVGTLSIAGTLTLAGNTNSVLSNATIQAGGTLDGYGGANNSSNNITNLGLIVADTAGQTLLIQGGTLANSQGTLAAVNGAILLAAASSMPIASGTLQSGSYLVSGNGSAIDLYAFGTVSNAVVTNNATITLNGLGASLFGRVATAGTYSSLEQSLTTIGTSGVLNLLSDRGFASTTGAVLLDSGSIDLGGGTLSGAGLSIDTTGQFFGHGVVGEAMANSGRVIADGGTLDLTAGYSGTGGITIDPGATMVLAGGTISQSILDNGALRVASGSLSVTGALTGVGGLEIGAGATLDVAGSTALDATFRGDGGILKLETPGGFSGRVIGFETGDTIDLVGLSITGTSLSSDGRTLVVSSTTAPVTLDLATSYTGATFGTGFDGLDFSNITVSGVNYNFEGPVWNSSTITWSYAASNLAGDSSRNAPYSSFFSSPADNAYETVVQNALSAWAALTGLTFVQSADSSAVDLRIGWGDFSTAGGEIGEANYSYNPSTNLFNPDVIVRLQDPTVSGYSLTQSGADYIYSGTSSSLYQVAVHEIGHALGLDHSSDAGAVMYPTATASNRAIDPSDAAGITALYGAAAVAPCYAGGTRILTEAGEIAVEALRPGMRVPGLVSGLLRRVGWIGHRSVRPSRHPRPHDVNPVRVRAHAFGPCAPIRDLVLSPDHAVFAHGALVPVRYLLNGATIAQEAAEHMVWFHVELEDDAGAAVHDVLLADGLPAESFLDTGNRGAFANGGGAVMAHPDFALRVWEAAACAPLLTEGDALASLRAGLLDRAERLGHRRATDPALALHAAGRRIVGRMRDGAWHVAHPGGRAVLSSTSGIPEQTTPALRDRRRLGVAVAAIALDGRPIRLDDPRLGAGWHAPEPGLRWTSGAAILTLPPGELAITLAAVAEAWAA